MKYVVIGAGRSGQAVARLLLMEKMGSVLLSDSAPEPDDQVIAELRSLGARFEFGGHSSEVLTADTLVISPGVPPDIPIVREAESQGIPVTNEIEIAAGLCRGRVVGITGTNGKTTTTELIGHCCRSAGRETWVAGNVGIPFSEIVQHVTPEGIVSLELSSFQLEKIDRFRPDVALLLNVTPDHMDRYDSVEGYADAKKRIARNMREGDLLIYNSGDSRLAGIPESGLRPRLRSFSLEEGSDATLDEGWLVVEGERIIPVESIGIRGPHNLQNSMAAALALRAVGLSAEEIAEGLRTFTALPHRLEEIATIDGVLWVNDSKGTNTDALKQALGSFGEPIILIAGGRGKANDYEPMRELVRQKVRTIVTLGEEGPALKEAFADDLEIAEAGMSLQRAVELAAGIAREGEVVLLSPACASFDMFRNFADRGDQFRRLVLERAKG